MPPVDHTTSASAMMEDEESIAAMGLTMIKSSPWKASPMKPSPPWEHGSHALDTPIRRFDIELQSLPAFSPGAMASPSPRVRSFMSPGQGDLMWSPMNNGPLSSYHQASPLMNDNSMTLFDASPSLSFAGQAEGEEAARSFLHRSGGSKPRTGPSETTRRDFRQRLNFEENAAGDTQPWMHFIDEQMLNADSNSGFDEMDTELPTRCEETLDSAFPESATMSSSGQEVSRVAPQTPLAIPDINTTCGATWSKLNAAGILTTVKKSAPRTATMSSPERQNLSGDRLSDSEEFSGRHSSSAHEDTVHDEVASSPAPTARHRAKSSRSSSHQSSVSRTPRKPGAKDHNSAVLVTSGNDSYVATVNCKCKKTKCLKLYCECFSMGQYCIDCKCKDCHNQPSTESERQDAMKKAKERKPDACHMKKLSAGGKPIKGGCHCKKSGCSKRYCECYEAGVPCTELCKCCECQNTADGCHLGGDLPASTPSGTVTSYFSTSSRRKSVTPAVPISTPLNTNSTGGAGRHHLKFSFSIDPQAVARSSQRHSSSQAAKQPPPPPPPPKASRPGPPPPTTPMAAPIPKRPLEEKSVVGTKTPSPRSTAKKVAVSSAVAAAGRHRRPQGVLISTFGPRSKITMKNSLHVLSFLDNEDLADACLVNKLWNSLSYQTEQAKARFD